MVRGIDWSVGFGVGRISGSTTGGAAVVGRGVGVVVGERGTGEGEGEAFATEGAAVGGAESAGSSRGAFVGCGVGRSQTLVGTVYGGLEAKVG